MDYQISEHFGESPEMRKLYYDYINEVFPGIEFEEWHKKGYWRRAYRTYSIIKMGKIISNVSAAKMDVYVNGKIFKAIQIGAVGTLQEYRMQGLSKRIMNYVIKKYSKDIDLIFLYANEDVLEFYKKLGFRHVKEYIFVNNTYKERSKYSPRKINIADENDYKLVAELIKRRLPITKLFGADDYGFITMWHVLNIFRDDIYYLDKENIVIIKQEKANGLHLHDVIFDRVLNLNDIIPKIVCSNYIGEIRFYFPPDQIAFTHNKTIDQDTMLFVYGNFNAPNRPFRFPVTAIT